MIVGLIAGSVGLALGLGVQAARNTRREWRRAGRAPARHAVSDAPPELPVPPPEADPARILKPGPVQVTREQVDFAPRRLVADSDAVEVPPLWAGIDDGGAAPLWPGVDDGQDERRVRTTKAGRVVPEVEPIPGPVPTFRTLGGIGSTGGAGRFPLPAAPGDVMTTTSGIPINRSPAPKSGGFPIFRADVPEA